MNAGSETKTWNMETVMWWFVQRRGNRWAQFLSVKIIKHFCHLSSWSPTNSVLTWHPFSLIIAFGFFSVEPKVTKFIFLFFQTYLISTHVDATRWWWSVNRERKDGNKKRETTSNPLEKRVSWMKTRTSNLNATTQKKTEFEGFIAAVCQMPLDALCDGK